MVLRHRASHASAQGQWLGRCRMGRALWSSQAGGDVDDLRRRVAPRATAWGPPARMPAARSRLWAIAAHRIQARVGAEASGGHVRQRPVDEVGEHGFDDGVAAVGDVGVGDRFGGVGEERVIPPDREQRVGVAGVFDAAHDQPGGDRVGGGSEGGVGGFGDFGIRDPVRRCRGHAPRRDSAPVSRRRPGSPRSPRARRGSWSTPARTGRRRGGRRPPRRRCRRPSRRAPGSARSTPAARAVAMAWATMRAAPLPESVLPARSRIPAITGAAVRC